MFQKACDLNESDEHASSMNISPFSLYYSDL